MVDELRQWPSHIRCFRAGSCHLTTDGPIEELHVFARRLGMRRAWFQDHRIAPHYDLTERRRDMALELGAVFVPIREQVMALRQAASTIGNPPSESARSTPTSSFIPPFTRSK